LATTAPTSPASSGTPTVSVTSSRHSSVVVRYASPPETGGTSSQNVAMRRYVSKRAPRRARGRRRSPCRSWRTRPVPGTPCRPRTS
jgi:hypothetical protein